MFWKWVGVLLIFDDVLMLLLFGFGVCFKRWIDVLDWIVEYDVDNFVRFVLIIIIGDLLVVVIWENCVWKMGLNVE